MTDILKIRFRAPEPEDVDTLYIWENDETNWPYGMIKAPVSRYTLSEWIRNMSDNPLKDGQLRLIAVDESNGESIGAVDLYNICGINGTAEIGIFVSPRYRNRGIGKIIIDRVCDYAGQGCLHLHTLCAKMTSDNLPCKKMFESCGFMAQGCLRSWIKVGSKRQDLFIMQKFI